MLNIDDLKFDEKGLITCVVTDYYSKQVLTVAYMSRESIAISMEEGKTCFYSRSRNELWRKGATSGNYQHIVAIKADCDRDALICEVIKDGPACHLGTESCFENYLYVSADTNEFSMKSLYDMIEGRKIEQTEGSYTTYLFQKGLDKILKKIGEEATEVIIGAKGNDKAETIYEICDLAYHVIVLMVEMGISNQDILKELASRNVVDHKIKQEKMAK